MDLYNLGEVTWWESQCLYHALAYLGREGLIICYPSSHYVCLGLHDDLEQEIDWEYCELSGIPVFRRETGGGVVYLDNRQVFFQLVMRRDNPRLHCAGTNIMRAFLTPPFQFIESSAFRLSLGNLQTLQLREENVPAMLVEISGIV